MGYLLLSENQIVNDTKLATNWNPGGRHCDHLQCLAYLSVPERFKYENLLKFFSFFFFVLVVLVLARQLLCHLSHASIPALFTLGYFLVRVSHFCLGWPGL
jgi:hypothetical protein